MEEKYDTERSSSDAHTHFAGRVTAGTELPICMSKNGVYHVSSLCIVQRILIIVGKSNYS